MVTVAMVTVAMDSCNDVDMVPVAMVTCYCFVFTGPYRARFGCACVERRFPVLSSNCQKS